MLYYVQLICLFRLERVVSKQLETPFFLGLPTLWMTGSRFSWSLSHAIHGKMQLCLPLHHQTTGFSLYSFRFGHDISSILIHASAFYVLFPRPIYAYVLGTKSGRLGPLVHHDSFSWVNHWRLEAETSTSSFADITHTRAWVSCQQGTEETMILDQTELKMDF